MKKALLDGQRRWLPRFLLVTCLLATFAGGASMTTGCSRREERLAPRSLTWAEVRAVRSGVRVTPPGESSRAPYPRERLSDGAKIEVAEGGLLWLRRDAGATLLVRGPAALTLRARSLAIGEGRLFADTPPGVTTELETPAGSLALSDVRASLDVSKAGAVRAYVLSGEVRGEKARARAGEELALTPGKAAEVRAVKAWEDWTGGLATTDRSAAPAPYGVGTVGARLAGELGKPRFPLAIQRMDVRVTFEGDFVVTEVDQVFFNPSSEVVEGLYGFRTPARAILQRFGVDREGVVVWGRVQEKAAAAAQYQANVYQGSTEDPALLEWDAPGVYRARLYPIGPGATRRVVVRYAEWLDRTGERGERRLYVYPMAAEGAEETLPHVEELKVTFELGRAKAEEVRTGMTGVRRGDTIVVREHDFVPRADLALELFDGGAPAPVAYTAPHSRDLEALPPSERASAAQKARSEADYVLVPVRATDAKLPAGGLDLAIVIDASAATDSATLAIARAATTTLLAHLGENDRALVLAGDSSLRPLVPGLTKLEKVSAATRTAVQDALAGVTRGGATDLGAMIADAARTLDPARRAAIVYLGDASPTVGELALTPLRERISRLPHPVRVFGLGVGDSARLDLLAGLARGAFAERITDGAQAARAALRVLEEAERPVWLGTAIDLGPNVERVFPREAGALVSGETLWVLGRVVADKLPNQLKLTNAAGTRELSLERSPIEDGGDLGRRWAQARLAQMLEDGEGRASLVDLGMRHGIITPVTSFYVPTANEMGPDERAELDTRRAARRASASQESSRDAKEGGTGVARSSEPLVNAKRETKYEMEQRADASHRYATKGPSADKAAVGEAAPPPPAAVPTTTPEATTAVAEPLEKLKGSKTARATAGSVTSNSVAPSDGGGFSAIGSTGRGGGIGTGQGLGAGHGRLGGSHATSAPKVRLGAIAVTGDLPPEVIQRIVRQSFGRFRVCYEQGLGGNPSLAGRITARFVIGRDGAVSNLADGGSTLDDQDVRRCVLSGIQQLSFPGPERGIVTVTLPITLEPNASGKPGEPQAAAPNVVINVFVGELPRTLFGCGKAAKIPLEDRVALWRERLASSAGQLQGVIRVYRDALASCEAYTARERQRLLALMLDAMPGIPAKVNLYRAMLNDRGAADVLYRGLLARIKTPEEMRALHGALGLKNMDPAILAKIVADTKDPAARAARLRALAREFPDDFGLILALLDALEDTGDRARASETARRLRERPDADASVRTALGELYLRLGEREKTTAEKAPWIAEAQRAFGEIVEFAPEDPVARRRLGDLLLAHGFFADAGRQYETLAGLTPDEPKVLLLRAAAAQGQGLLEEALKWTEKGGASGAPDAASGAAVTARALAATYLAWARAEARTANRDEELGALTARAARVLASGRADPDKPLGARVSLTWSHPELHPTLWTNALGAPMPAPEGDVTLGILQAVVPERDGSYVEVRLEPDDVAHAARLGAVAELTVVFDELGATEKIVRVPVRFERSGPATRRFSLAGKEVRGG